MVRFHSFAISQFCYFHMLMHVRVFILLFFAFFQCSGSPKDSVTLGHHILVNPARSFFMEYQGYYFLPVYKNHFLGLGYGKPHKNILTNFYNYALDPHVGYYDKGYSLYGSYKFSTSSAKKELMDFVIISGESYHFHFGLEVNYKDKSFDPQHHGYSSGGSGSYYQKDKISSRRKSFTISGEIGSSTLHRFFLHQIFINVGFRLTETETQYLGESFYLGSTHFHPPYSTFKRSNYPIINAGYRLGFYLKKRSKV